MAVKIKFIRPNIKNIFNSETGEIVKFNLQNWFFVKYPKLYQICCYPNKPHVFDEERKQDDEEDKVISYINTFPGYLFKNPNPFYKYSKELQDRVKTIIYHIQKVLCSGKPDQEYYMMHWLADLISGKKMNKALFLYSGQGTGKTLITKYLHNKVLGQKITMKHTN